MDIRICTKCKEEKPRVKFGLRTKSKDGIDQQCKDCKSKYGEEYRKNNKEKIKKDCKILNSNPKHKEKMKNYYLVNKEAYFKRSKKYKTKNKVKILEYNKIYFPNRYRNNIQYKISQILRSKMYFVLRGKEHKSFMKYLDCSINDLKLHLEKQFLPEFTWENHGKIWEVDHIKAIANFNLILEEDKARCFHYTNLQPLFKTTEIAESFGYLDQIGNRNKNKY
jgi:hypothetical protein